MSYSDCSLHIVRQPTPQTIERFPITHVSHTRPPPSSDAGIRSPPMYLQQRSVSEAGLSSRVVSLGSAFQRKVFAHNDGMSKVTKYCMTILPQHGRRLISEWCKSSKSLVASVRVAEKSTCVDDCHTRMSTVRYVSASTQRGTPLKTSCEINRHVRCTHAPSIAQSIVDGNGQPPVLCKELCIRVLIAA